METITDILVQKNNKDRVNIYIDGAYVFSCSLELVLKKSLKKGLELSMEELNSIVSLDNYNKCKNKALNIIEKSYKTETEVKNKLLQLSYDEDTISKVIEFLKNYNFVDDKKYAKLYTNEKKKSRGILKIALELRKKGIDENIISEAVKIDYEEAFSYAMEAATKKYNSCKSHGDSYRSILSKLYSYLKSIGYEEEIINEVLNKIKQEYNNNISYDDKEKLQGRIYKEALKRYNALLKKGEESKHMQNNISNYLCRKGYDLELILPVVEKIVNNNEMG